MLNYIVVLDEPATNIPYNVAYFPRGFRFKDIAEHVHGIIMKHGGKSRIIPRSQFSIDLLRQVKQ